MGTRGKYWLQGSRDADRAAIMWREDFWLVPKVRTSLWLWLAVATLLISNVLFLVAFLTPGWGQVIYTDLDPVTNQTQEYTVKYGLWMACREPDNFCLGSGHPNFFGATRAFCVLSLFGHVLSIAALLGLVLEKMFDYDPCGLGLITACCFSTTCFTLIAVCVFGVMWPREYREQIPDSTLSLRYSFIIACVTLVLPLVAGVMCLVEIRQSLVRLVHYKIETEHLRPEYDVEPGTSGLRRTTTVAT